MIESNGDPRDQLIAQLEGELRVLRQELHNARLILHDSDADFYGDDVPPELIEENGNDYGYC